MRRTGQQLTLIVMLTSVMANSNLTLALPQGAREYAVKAAFIYNFAKFVEWPSAAFGSPDSPFILCVIGNDPFGETLDTLRGKKVQGRPLSLRRSIRPQELSTCHIIFVGVTDPPRMRALIKELQHRPILTIGDLENFTRVGGIINFFIEQRKIRFAINVEAAQRASLQVSSRLLNLAKIISDKSR